MKVLKLKRIVKRIQYQIGCRQKRIPKTITIMVFVVVYILYCSYDRGGFICFTKFNACSDGKINYRDDENAFVTVRPAAVICPQQLYL